MRLGEQIRLLLASERPPDAGGNAGSAGNEVRQALRVRPAGLVAMEPVFPRIANYPVRTVCSRQLSLITFYRAPIAPMEDTGST